MRLHRLTLRDVKGVTERTVDFPEDGIVVVEGPNEVGKSTMLEAFDLLLSRKSSSKHSEIKALQPAGRDVGPFVEAEFTVGGTRLRYAKQWLRSPRAELHVLSGRPESLTGDQAQDRVAELLRAHLDEALWSALRLTQSGDGTVHDLGSSTVLTEALDAAAGAHQHAAGADALLDQVHQEYLTYYTATGRVTGEFKEAQQAYTAAQLGLAEAHRRVEEAAELVRRHAAAVEQAERTGTDLAQARELLAAAQERATQAEAVAAAHARAGTTHDQAVSLLASARREQAARGQLVAELAAAQREHTNAQARREADLAEAEPARERLVVTTAEAEAARADLDEADDRLEEARCDLERLADRAALAVEEARVDQVRGLAEAAADARAAMPAHHLDRRLLDELRQEERRLQTARILLVRSSPSLVVDARSDLSVTDLRTGHRRGTAAGEHESYALVSDTRVELADGTTLRIDLPVEARAHAERLDEETTALEARLLEAGVGSVEELAEVVEQAEAARRALRDAERDVDTVVRPLGRALVAEALAGQVPAALLQRVEAARARVAAGASDRPLPTDEIAARVTVDDATRARDRARAAQRATATAAQQAADQVAALRTRLDRTSTQVDLLAERVESLTVRLAEAREAQPDAALESVVAEHAAAVEQARAAIQETARAVAAADVEGARRALQTSVHQVRLRTTAHEAATGDVHRLSGQVEMAAGEGRQELLDRAHLALDEAERDLAAVDRRARAARHLWTTLQRHREEAHRSYVRPFTQALEDLGRRVYGPTFQVGVDEQLRLVSRTVDGTTVPFEDLSGGAKEQLGILARLAVARLVDPTRGVPVVIDDALGYSDPERLRQMGQVLGSAGADGAQLQVILLTCTPGRYAAIRDVHTIRLTA